MSELMLHGVLNAPIEPGDVMGVIQLKNRARQASELICAQQKRIEELENDNMRLFTALKETLDAMDLGDYPARHIAFSALSEGGGDERTG